MLNVEYTKGVKINGVFEALETLDNIIVLSPHTYYDAVTKLGRIYMSLKSDAISNVEVDRNLANNDDFFQVLKPVIDMIALNLNIALEGDNYKAKFTFLLNKADAMGTILFDFTDYSVTRLSDEENLRTGIKITDESGGCVYSFEYKDRDNIGRIRNRYE